MVPPRDGWKISRFRNSTFFGISGSEDISKFRCYIKLAIMKDEDPFKLCYPEVYSRRITFGGKDMRISEDLII
jgi:hypothetical protein